MAEIEGYYLPDDLYYHREHMWVKKEGEMLKVGIDDFSQKLAGEFSYIDLPEIGTKVSKDDVIGSYETGKWMGKIYAPVSGEIIEVNKTLEDKPFLINEDPYGKGWIFILKPSNPKEIDELMHGEDAINWLKQEIEKYAKK